MVIRWKWVIISLAVGAVAGLLSYLWQMSTGISDIYQRLCIARAFLSGAPNPYASCMVLNFNQPAAEYPLTTILLLAPLSFLSDSLAASLFWGVSNGLLVYGILRRGELRYLLVFTSGVYWASFMWQQFSVLIMAVVLLPNLLPLTLIKPQIGLPIILTNLTKRRLITCAAFVALTFALYPHWLFDWYARSNNYNGLIPLLVLPFGPLLAMVAFKWRDKDTRLLLFMALAPQRTLMDSLALFTIPKSIKSLATLCLLSWMPAVLFIPNPANGDTAKMMPLVLLTIYLPLLMMQYAPELQSVFCHLFSKLQHQAP